MWLMCNHSLPAPTIPTSSLSLLTHLCSFQPPGDLAQAHLPFITRGILRPQGGGGGWGAEVQYSYYKIFWFVLQESDVEDTSHPMAWL